jgi:hypothetical protein
MRVTLLGMSGRWLQNCANGVACTICKHATMQEQE